MKACFKSVRVRHTALLAVDSLVAHNRLDPFDVNSDRLVTQLDVLAIFNDLNAEGSRVVQRLRTISDGRSFYVDANGDGFVSSLDALQVINFLNDRLAAEEELQDALKAIARKLGYNRRSCPM